MQLPTNLVQRGSTAVPVPPDALWRIDPAAALRAQAVGEGVQ
jgi:hypothetical protein